MQLLHNKGFELMDSMDDDEDEVSRFDDETVPCFLHTLQLVVKDVLIQTQQQLEPIYCSIEKARLISMALHQKIDDVEAITGDKRIRFFADCPTRWGSTFDLVENVVKHKDIVTKSFDAKIIDSSIHMNVNDFKNCSIYLEVTNALNKLESLRNTLISYYLIIAIGRC